MGASDTLLEFRRRGGAGGNDEHLVVTADGHATLHRAGAAREIELSPATLDELRRELDAARLGELPEDLRRRPPGADEPPPDVVEYVITAGGHTVRALGSALPPELLAVVETLNVAIGRETTQGGGTMDEQARERQQAATMPENDAIGILLRQHAEIRDLFAKVHASSGSDRRDAFDALRRLLAVHEAAEEEVLRPVTRMSLPDGGAVADARIAEENQAKHALARLEEMGPDAPGFDAEFRQFEQAVLDHAEHEEREEFPGVHERRNRAQLEAMGLAIRAAEAMAPTHPHPNVETVTGTILTGPFAAMVDRVRDVVRKATG